ncbi:MAG: repeat protein [Phycisphaerales bacterium]|nr:repeat protein [Phycisphaerales bacterium]
MRTWQLAASLVLGSAGLCFAQTTRPSPTTLPASPATQPAPTTRPAPATQAAATQAASRPYVNLDDLLKRLSSDAWQQRQRAQDELVRMGDEARPVVKDLLARTTDTEVRTRLEAAVAQIDENRISGPSFITMHFKDADPREVFAELSKQCYATLKPFPDNLFDQPGLSKVTIDIDHQPFWAAMKQIADKTGIDLQQYSEGMRLMRGAFRMNSPFTTTRGPFLVVATQVDYSQTMMLANGGGATSNFAVHLVAYSEPKLQIISSTSAVKLEEAVDDAGNSLLPTGPDNRGYYGGGGGTWNLYAQLHHPDHPGQKIARLRGSAKFVIQTKSQKIEIPVAGIKENAQVIGDMPVLIHDLKKNAEIWELRLSATPDTMGNRWAQLQQSVQTRLQLVDAQGIPLDHRGMSSRGGNNGIEFTILFTPSNNRPAADRASADPAKLVWEVPTATKEIPVPFEFKDVPMPH